MTQPISFRRHRFPADLIYQAVWLYFRFTLSIRDVEEFMAIAVSKSAARRSGARSSKFGPMVAATRTIPCNTFSIPFRVDA